MKKFELISKLKKIAHKNGIKKPIIIEGELGYIISQRGKKLYDGPTANGFCLIETSGKTIEIERRKKRSKKLGRATLYVNRWQSQYGAPRPLLGRWVEDLHPSGIHVIAGAEGEEVPQVFQPEAE